MCKCSDAAVAHKCTKMPVFEYVAYEYSVVCIVYVYYMPTALLCYDSVTS
jgi:hypothetical protein